MQMKKSAHFTSVQCKQRGFIVPPVILLIVGGIVILVVIAIASGALKMSGSIKYTPKEQPAAEQQTTPKEESTQPVEEQITQPAQANLAETYTHDSPKYTINYPTGWGIMQSAKNVTIFQKSSETTTAQTSEAGVVITPTTLGQLKGSKLSTIVDLSKNKIKQQFTGATFTGERDTKVGSYDAYVFDLIYADNNKDFQSQFYILIDSDNLYGVIVTANKAVWPKYENTLLQIVNSLKLLQ